tara:strand:+ start:1149 stop:2063 length:915 start_codon:yes stop_codon:yes gene_type:complete
MRYYYFNPFSKQYLFPSGFKKYELFTSFYQAYTFKGKVLWWLWCNVSVFRKLCQVTKPEEIIPIAKLERYIKKDTILAFNRGTKGIEQKTSILGIDLKTQDEFFIKYADTELSRKNVNNEGEILGQLAVLEFVPQLIKHINKEEFTFIQTTVLNGERVVNQNIEKQLLSVLNTLATLNIVAKNECNTELDKCFAHGDFCPWNMMISNKKLQVFDWEMAGCYPVGFDLFTYVFQTSFLLTPKISIEKIMKQNEELIQRYFQSLSISDWTPYLIDFAELKCEMEKEKENSIMINKFKELSLYVTKK